MFCEKLLKMRMKPRNDLCLLLPDVWGGVKPGRILSSWAGGWLQKSPLLRVSAAFCSQNPLKYHLKYQVWHKARNIYGIPSANTTERQSQITASLLFHYFTVALWGKVTFRGAWWRLEPEPSVKAPCTRAGSFPCGKPGQGSKMPSPQQLPLLCSEPKSP